MRQGKYLVTAVQTSENTTWLLAAVTDKGGHSSLPIKENAIYRLAAGLGKIRSSRSRSS
jgi:hypothetical protein